MSGHLKHYVKAFVAELEAGLDFTKAKNNLVELLKRQKHEPMLRQILEKSLMILAQKSNPAVPTIVLASETDKGRYSLEFVSKVTPVIKIDPTIIGGYITSENFVQTDQSYKSKLLNWYQSATKSN